MGSWAAQDRAGKAQAHAHSLREPLDPRVGLFAQIHLLQQVLPALGLALVQRGEVTQILARGQATEMNRQLNANPDLFV